MTRRISDTGFVPQRRAFLRGTGLAAAAAAGSIGLAMAPAKGGGVQTTTLVYLFLQGGMDGLSFVVPRSGANYDYYLSRRPNIGISNLSDNPTLNLGSGFGLHPRCTGLKQLWDQNRLAIIHACGHPEGTHTRSHFDAQEEAELGTPGSQGSQAGWLARYLQHSPQPPGAIFSAMVSGSNPPSSLGGWSNVATLDSTGSFHPNSGRYGNTHLAALQALYSGSGGLDAAAQEAVSAVDLVQTFLDADYVPAGGVVYPNNGIGDDFELVAQLIRANVGVQVATLSMGGWDDHNGQGVQNGNYANRVEDLSEALTAFYRDLEADGRINEVAVVVQTEFGRQITENANQGCDHGLGNPMLVLGGGAVGGLYGSFPSLAGSGPQYGDSVRPLTDFRTVMASVVGGLLGNNNIDQIFPSSFSGDNFLTQYGNNGPLGFVP